MVLMIFGHDSLVPHLKDFNLFDLKTGAKMALKAGDSDGQGQHFAGA